MNQWIEWFKAYHALDENSTEEDRAGVDYLAEKVCLWIGKQSAEWLASSRNDTNLTPTGFERHLKD